MASAGLDELERRLACDPWTAPLPLRPGEPSGPLESIVPPASAREAAARCSRACCLLCLQQPKTPAALAVLPVLCESGRVLACDDLVRAVVAALPPTAHSIERAGLVLLTRFCARRAAQAASAAAAAGDNNIYLQHAVNGASSVRCSVGAAGGGGGGLGVTGCGSGVGDALSFGDAGCSAMLTLICTSLAQHLTLDLAANRLTVDTIRDGLSTRNTPRAPKAKTAGALQNVAAPDTGAASNAAAALKAAAARAAAGANAVACPSPGSVGSHPSGSAGSTLSPPTGIAALPTSIPPAAPRYGAVPLAPLARVVALTAARRLVSSVAAAEATAAAGGWGGGEEGGEEARCWGWQGAGASTAGGWWGGEGGEAAVGARGWEGDGSGLIGAEDGAAHGPNIGGDGRGKRNAEAAAAPRHEKRARGCAEGNQFILQREGLERRAVARPGAKVGVEAAAGEGASSVRAGVGAEAGAKLAELNRDGASHTAELFPAPPTLSFWMGEAEEALHDCLRLLAAASPSSPDFRPLPGSFLTPLLPPQPPHAGACPVQAVLGTYARSKPKSKVGPDDRTNLIPDGKTILRADGSKVKLSSGEQCEVRCVCRAPSWHRSLRQVEHIAHSQLAQLTAEVQAQNALLYLTAQVQAPLESQPAPEQKPLPPKQNLPALQAPPAQKQPLPALQQQNSPSAPPDWLLGSAGLRALRWANEVGSGAGGDSGAAWRRCLTECAAAGGQEEVVLLCSVLVGRLGGRTEEKEERSGCCNVGAGHRLSQSPAAAAALTGIYCGNGPAGAYFGTRSAGAYSGTKQAAEWAAAMLAEGLSRPALCPLALAHFGTHGWEGAHDTAGGCGGDGGGGDGGFNRHPSNLFGNTGGEGCCYDNLGEQMRLPSAAWLATAEMLLATALSHNTEIGERDTAAVIRQGERDAEGGERDTEEREEGTERREHDAGEMTGRHTGGAGAGGDNVHSGIAASLCEQLLLLPFESCCEELAGASAGIPPGGAPGIPPGALLDPPAVPWAFSFSGGGCPTSRAAAIASPPPRGNPHATAAPPPPGIFHRCGRCHPPDLVWQRTLSYFWPAVVKALGAAPAHSPVLESVLRCAAALVGAHDTGGGIWMGAWEDAIPGMGSFGRAGRIPLGSRGGRPESAPHPRYFSPPHAHPHSASMSPPLTGWAFLRLPRAVALHCCRVSHLYLPAVLPLMNPPSAVWLLHMAAIPEPIAYLPANGHSAGSDPVSRTETAVAPACVSAALKPPIPRPPPPPPSAAALLSCPATLLQLCARALTPLAYTPQRPAALARLPALAPSIAHFRACMPKGAQHAGSRVFCPDVPGLDTGGGRRLISAGATSLSNRESPDFVPAAAEDLFFLPAGNVGPSPDLLLASHSAETLAAVFLPPHAPATERRRRAELLCDLMLDWAGEGLGEAVLRELGRGVLRGAGEGATDGMGEALQRAGRGGGWVQNGPYPCTTATRSSAGGQAAKQTPLMPCWAGSAAAQAETARAVRRFLSLLAQARADLNLEPDLAATLVRRSGQLRAKVGAAGV